jgi:hypothetical protein
MSEVGAEQSFQLGLWLVNVFLCPLNRLLKTILGTLIILASLQAYSLERRKSRETLLSSRDDQSQRCIAFILTD